jgi:hypothetical protein
MVDVLSCNNVWPRAKFFFMFVACAQSMGKKCCEIFGSAKDQTKVLSTLGKIMYSQDSPLDHDYVLWAQLQIDIMATNYPNAN